MNCRPHPSSFQYRYHFPVGYRLFVDKVPFVVLRCTTEGVEAIREDGVGCLVLFSYADLETYNRNGRLYHHRAAASSFPADPEVDLAKCFSGLREPEARDLMSNLMQVEAYQELCGDPKFRPSKMTAREFKDAMRAVVGRNCEAVASGGRRGYAARVVTVPGIKGLRQIQRLSKAYADKGLAGLLSRTKDRGNCENDLPEPVLIALHQRALDYLDPGQPSMKVVHQRLEGDIENLNAQRAERGEPRLDCPCFETVRAYINEMDPFSVAFARRGLEYAIKKFKPIGDAPRASRPLEIVEIDEWPIDLIFVLVKIGVWEKLTQQEKEQLGLVKNTARWYMTVAIDTYSRCILAMRLSPTPSAQVARSVVEMITIDKEEYSDAVGALTKWFMCGTPCTIRTDNAQWYCSPDFRLPLADLGVAFDRTAAGMAWLRPYIESWFGVVAKTVVTRLSGRTMSDICKRGDFDSEADAALTIDDFTEIIIRWIVDVYHNSPHGGLLGKTPIQVWIEGVTELGVEMGPCLERRRFIFGERLTRVVQRDGITVLGVRYQSDELQEWQRHQRDKEVRVRWHPSDLGAVVAELGNTWVEVAAAQDEFKGLSADKWIGALRRLRAENKRAQEVSRHSVRDALAEIDKTNAAARKRADLTVKDWSAEAIASIEKRLTVGFSVASDRRPPAEGGMFVDTYERSGPPAVDNPVVAPSTAAPSRSVSKGRKPAPEPQRAEKRQAPKPFTGSDDESGGLA